MGGVERFNFTWVGKRKALELAYTPTSLTLRPKKDQSKNWDSTENIYIEGDNLEVLKLLQKSYANQIKMIYIDPPYNTGKDFIYKDNFHQSKQDFDAKQGVIDAEGNRLEPNLPSNGRFHSDWCSMIYSRLLLARDLLTDDGVIFISIDDNEQANLKKICDEVFGEGNFIASVVWERAYSPVNLKKHFSSSHDYILCYTKNIELAVCNGINRSEEADSRYINPDNDPRGVWKPSDLSVGPAIEKNIYPIETPSGRIVMPPAGRSWRQSEQSFLECVKDNRIWFGTNGNNVPSLKRFKTELKKTGVTPMTLWKYTEVGHSQSATKALVQLFDNKHYFDYPKPVDLIKRCIQLYSNPNDLILDFFSGSATTAHAVMQLNAEDGGKRKFICVQLPEACDEKSEAYQAGFKNICEIGKERIRRAGAKIEEKLQNGSIKLQNSEKISENISENQGVKTELDTGFRVFSLDESNFQDVQKTANNTSQEDLFASNIKPSRTDLDLFFESLINWGIALNQGYQTLKVGGSTIHCYANGALVACFDPVDDKVLQKLSEINQKSRIVRLVLLNASFERDDAFLNIQNQLKRLLPDTEIRVI